MVIPKKTKLSLILILINLILLGIVFLSLQASKMNLLLAYIQFFLICSLVSLVIAELIRLVLPNKSPWIIIIPIAGIVLYAVFNLTIRISQWSSRIDNLLIIPENYQKEFLMIVYGAKTGEDITPDYSQKRKRTINFPPNGIFLTSTRLTSTLQQIDNPIIKKTNGDTIQGQYFDGFYRSNGREFGYKYSIIALTSKIHFNRDSLFRAEKIDFRILDKK